MQIGKISLADFQLHHQELGEQNVVVTEEEVTMDNNMNLNNDMINKDITVEVFMTHAGKLKSNKSPGIDNILNEFIKYCPR